MTVRRAVEIKKLQLVTAPKINGNAKRKKLSRQEKTNLCMVLD